MARQTFKLGILKPMKLKDYSFGLFLFEDYLCLKTLDGGAYDASSGEDFFEYFGVNESVEITPLEY